MTRTSRISQPSCGNPAKRRILLVASGTEADRVLCEPAASAAHAELQQQAALYPGRTVAAEWWREKLGQGVWVRWLEMTVPLAKEEAA